MKNKKGFTLIEVLLVIAMIAILSAAILVAVSGQRDKARTSKVLVELSGTLQPMMMCVSDGETVDDPDLVGGGNICDGEPAYGQWPDVSDFGTYSSSGLDTGGWYICAQNNDGTESICCNSTYMKCGLIEGECSSCDGASL